MLGTFAILLSSILAEVDEASLFSLVRWAIGFFALLLIGVGLFLLWNDRQRRRPRNGGSHSSEEQFRTLVEQAADGIFVTDAAGRYLDVNTSACEMLGYTRDELLRMNILDLIPREDLSTVQRGLEEIRQGHRRIVERRLRCKDGSLLHVEIGAKLLSDGRTQAIVRDISERKRTEQALRDQRQLLENILGHIPHAVFWKDRRSLYLGCNDSAARHMGKKSPAEVVGKTDYDMPFTREEADSYIASDRQVMETNQSLFDLEQTQRRPDGSQAVLLTSKVPLRNGAGEVIGVLGIYTDITERKRIEQALAESEERFQAFMDHSPLVAFLKDAEGRYVYGNRAWAAQFRPAVAEPLGKTDFDLWPQETALLFRDSDARALNAGQTLEQVETGSAADGTVRHWIVLKFPVHSARGLLLGGLVVDISERVRAEEELRLSEERYRTLVDTAQEVIFTLSPEGLLTSLNPAFEALSGYRREEVLNKPFLPLVHPDDLPFVTDLVQRMFLGERIPATEIRCLKKSGEVYVTETVTTPLLKDGRVVAVLGVTRDITARKRLEEQLRQAQKMEAIGQLAGGVAHDFNNMLTVITGYSSLLLAGARPDDPARELFDGIRKAAERAAALTQQLLAFSRKQLLAPVVLDLNTVVAHTEQMLRPLIGEHIELATQLAPDLGHAKADPGQISQVLLNLAVNARDAMPDGGRLAITTADVELDTEYAHAQAEVKPGRYVRLSVSDTGCGMDEPTKAHLFEPFFTTKEIGKGTGLGLATIYGIIKQSGGHIEVESEVGGGTTFHLFLPRYDGPLPEPAPRPGGATELRGTETVLVVEDEATVRALVRRILERNGYTVLEARHGSEGLRLCEQHNGSIDLVVSDVVMPEMSGRELFERVTAVRPGVKFLYISGYTDDALVRQGVHGESARLLLKPFTPAMLTRKVREVLDG